MAYSIIIPSRNIENLTACVKALRDWGETGNVIVVSDFDNHDSVTLECLNPEVDLFVMGGKPFCFSRNVNIGIRAAGEDDVVLLNDDCLLMTREGFKKLGYGVAWEPAGGIMAATTNVTGYPAQLPHNIGYRPAEVAAFMCVYIPRATIDRVGLLDERFVTYGGEDVNYCLRVREAGMEVGVYDGCFVDHSTLTSTYRGPAPRNSAPGDIEESNRLGIEKWGDKWPHRRHR